MPNGLNIESSETAQGDVVLRLSGTLDAKSAPAFVHECQQVRRKHRNLVLNFSSVTFIASSGVGSVLALVEEFAESGLSVRLASLSTVVQSVLQLLNLHRFLNIDATEEDALSELEAA